MKKIVSFLTVCIMSLCSLIGFSCGDPCKDGHVDADVNYVCDNCMTELEKPQEPEEPEQSVNPSDENVGSPIFNQISPQEGMSVKLLKDYVQRWVSDYVVSSTTSISTCEYYANNNKECYGDIENGVDDEFYPVPLTIEFSCSDDSAKSFVVDLATDKNFEKNKVSIETTQKSIVVENLFVSKTYFWRVTAKFDSKPDEVSKRYSFSTESGIRTIKVEGVSNTRDLGGGVSKGNKIINLIGTGDKQIKQGLIYRSASLNDITSNGRKELVNVLGVKTQIDLRKSSEYSSQPTISGLKHLTIGTNGAVSIQGAGELSWLYRLPSNSKLNPILKKELEYFATETNYPIIFNCSAGRDRTGCLAFLIKALCGAEKKDLLRDYEFGCFSWFGSNWGREKDGTSQVDNVLSAVYNAYNEIYYNYEGNTFADKTYSFLLDCGLSSATLDKIITLNVELL